MALKQVHNFFHCLTARIFTLPLDMSWFSYLLLMYRKQYGWCFMALGQFLKSKVAPVQFSLRTKWLWNPVIKVGKPRPLGDISSSYYSLWASQVALVVKNLPANSGDTGDTVSMPGSERSPGERNGNPLQCPCLENPMDRGAWQATVHGVAKSQAWLSEHAVSRPLQSSSAGLRG